MTKRIHPVAFLGAVAGAILGAALLIAGFASVTHANPSSFAPKASSAVATSTPTFQTPGVATTTTIYDAYGVNGTNESAFQTTFAADSAELFVQFTGSSTASQLNINLEYSDDKIDWYQASPGMPVGYASTTLPIALQQVPQYQWRFASSTLGGIGVSATNNFDTRAIEVKTPTRYVRAVISCATGGTNCAVWTAFVPKKQSPNN